MMRTIEESMEVRKRDTAFYLSLALFKKLFRFVYAN